MAIAMDPEHPWRSMAFKHIPVTVITPPTISLPRTMSDKPGEYGSSQADVHEWLDYNADYRVPHSLAQVSMHEKTLGVVTEVLDISGHPTVDGSIVRVDDLEYDFQTKATNVEYSHEGQHMSVQPQLNEAAVRSMTHSLSVEDFAKTAGFKLPRVTAPNGPQHVSPLGPTDGEGGGMLINRFEELRELARNRASSDDYGARLHNLARIVCHAVVSESMGSKHQPTKASSWTRTRSILTAETPLLGQREMQTNSWWYIGSESAASFRAFLLMGARGLHYYVSPGSESVYSKLRSEPEVLSDRGVVFVRLTGSIPNPHPQPNDFLDVLSHSQMALDYYFAYAASLGIGHQATEILAQCAVAPFIYSERAALPYKRNSPVLDACPYVLRPVLEQKVMSVDSVQDLIFSAPVIAARTMAGLGAIITSFANGSRVATADVIAQLIGVLGNPDTARELVKQCHAAQSAGSIGLEWMSPFTDVTEGYARCVNAYRRSGALLCQNRRSIVKELAPIWSGVDMKNAMFGAKMIRGSKYVELVMMQLAGGKALSCMSEKFVQNALDEDDYTGLAMMRSWKAAHVFSRYNVAIHKLPEVDTEALSYRSSASARSASESSAVESSIGFLPPALLTSEAKSEKSGSATVRAASTKHAKTASIGDDRGKRHSGSSSDTSVSVGRLAGA
ncbi:MAG: hypothetical protein KM765_s4gp1 [Coniothyrium diplodiella chrysovirus 1]|uniref:hypothetical protein n=1 Tax=Coniothyrium diplodiella chrysovirus 1 TaxID=2587540 RepID=UPI001BE58399|nr:MAG: hypothetical protein KM765_s4gp1 [Coniothyrium diplodiella chrysovirus 1]QDB74974.1 MAG: hypothetical protein [Coniothyrium diplodiella chrysovirus 1]